MEQENLVFYSVPYESGWTATVNGEPAEVEQVSVGFMAVRAPAGENTIRFEYRTPGLSVGILISLGAGIFLLGYCLAVWQYRKKHPENRVRSHKHRLFVEDSEPVKAAEAYQRYISAQSPVPGGTKEEAGEE